MTSVVYDLLKFKYSCQKKFLIFPYFVIVLLLNEKLFLAAIFEIVHSSLALFELLKVFLVKVPSLQIRISNKDRNFSGDSATSSTSSSREKLNGSSDRISNITTSIRKTLNPKKDLKQPASLPPVAASMTSSNPSLGKERNPGLLPRNYQSNNIFMIEFCLFWIRVAFL